MSKSNPFELSMAQEFQVEKYKRILDETKDPETLRRAAKLMLEAYQKQRAATQWVMRQHLDAVWSGRLDRM